MDPNVALSQLRVAMAQGNFDEAYDQFENLDHWLTRGGFLPEAWGTRVTQSHPLPIGVDEALSQLRAVIEEKARLGVGTLLANQGNCND